MGCRQLSSLNAMLAHPDQKLTFSALDDGAKPLAVVLLHQDILQLVGDDPHHRRLVLLAVGAAC